MDYGSIVSGASCADRECGLDLVARVLCSLFMLGAMLARMKPELDHEMMVAMSSHCWHWLYCVYSLTPSYCHRLCCFMMLFDKKTEHSHSAPVNRWTDVVVSADD